MVSFRFSLLCSAAVLALSTAASPTTFLPEPSFEPFESLEPSAAPFLTPITAIPIPTEEALDVSSAPFDDALFESPAPSMLPDLPGVDVTPTTFQDNGADHAKPIVSPVSTNKPHVSPAYTDCAYGKPSDRSPVCYFEKRKCCHKFKPCGYEVKKVRSYVPITHKVCRNELVRKCYNVPKKVLTKECKYQKVKIPCKHSHGYNDHHYVKDCEPTYESKKVCCDKWVIKYDKVCKNITEKKCELVKAKQIVFKFYKYPKYCAKLECGSFYKQGDYKKPEDYTSKDGKFVREIKGEKITHEKEHYKH